MDVDKEDSSNGHSNEQYIASEAQEDSDKKDVHEVRIKVETIEDDFSEEEEYESYTTESLDHEEAPPSAPDLVECKVEIKEFPEQGMASSSNENSREEVASVTKVQGPEFVTCNFPKVEVEDEELPPVPQPTFVPCGVEKKVAARDEASPGLETTNDAAEMSNYSEIDLPYVCEHCGKGFPTKELRTYHRTNPSKTPCVCQICGKSFSRCRYLAKHKLRHARGKVFPCNYCGICFTEEEFLSAHLKTHSEEQPFQCELCGKGFSSKDTYGKHWRRHTQVPAHVCDVCGKSFFDKCVLVAHQRMHSDERPYCCDVCGTKFRQSGTLRVHKRSHQEGRTPTYNRSPPGPYMCTHCGKTFLKYYYYQQHWKRLTAEREHTCAVCGKGFLMKCLLIKHQKRHEERPFSCDMCRKKFRLSSALEEHKKSRHAVEFEASSIVEISSCDDV